MRKIFCYSFFAVMLVGLLSLYSLVAVAEIDDLKERHNSEAPIEISADTLEVRQEDNIAIFRGNVDALQGNMLLKADMLIVHYRPNDDSDQPGISKIDADGNVFVSSPNETAQGASGIYDVDEQMIWLTGNVVLTQGNNVIKGGKLELNLESGKSRVLGADSTSGPKTRVQGLFVPKKRKDK